MASNMFGRLKQAATRLADMVGIEATSTQQHGQPPLGDTQARTSEFSVDGDPLDESRHRVDSLRDSMDHLKSTLITYSKQLLTFTSAAAQVSQEWAGLYSHSPARSNSIQTFTSNQTRIEAAAFRLYKENYGWDILKVFDDWESDATKMMSDIDKTDKARQQVAGFDEKVRSLRQAKERRLKKNEPVNASEEQQLEAAEQMLEKYSVMLSNMRVNLDKNLNNFFEQRFAVLDKAFVRFMEIQIEFYKECTAASANYQTIVDNYRKRFPRQQGNQYGATPDAKSPLPTPSNADIDLVPHLNGSSQPSRSQSTPPQHDVDMPIESQSRGAGEKKQIPSRPAPAPVKPTAQQQRDTDSDTDTDSGSDATDSSDDEDETPNPTPKKAHGHHHHHHDSTSSNTGSAAAEPAVLDLFNFPSSSPPAPASKPVKASSQPVKSSSPVNSTDDVLDFFGSAPKASPPATNSASSNKPKTTSASAKQSPTSDSDFSFDFSGGGGSNNPLHVSSSSPTLSSQKKKDTGLTSFDPFASPPSAKNNVTSPILGAVNPTTKKSNAAPARSSSPPPAAPGTTQSGLGLAYIPPTHELQDHIAEQQERKVAEMREREGAADAHLEARREAETNLEGMLSAWENNKDGNKKNIRNLLSSVHTVLWPNSGWKPVSFADLIDFNAIKKAHMKVIRVVHPDKLIDATPDQLVIALRVFDVLNTAFDRFKETGQ